MIGLGEHQSAPLTDAKRQSAERKANGMRTLHLSIPRLAQEPSSVQSRSGERVGLGAASGGLGGGRLRGGGGLGGGLRRRARKGGNLQLRPRLEAAGSRNQALVGGLDEILMGSRAVNLLGDLRESVAGLDLVGADRLLGVSRLRVGGLGVASLRSVTGLRVGGRSGGLGSLAEKALSHDFVLGLELAGVVDILAKLLLGLGELLGKLLGFRSDLVLLAKLVVDLLLHQVDVLLDAGGVGGVRRRELEILLVVIDRLDRVLEMVAVDGGQLVVRHIGLRAYQEKLFEILGGVLVVPAGLACAALHEQRMALLLADIVSAGDQAEGEKSKDGGEQCSPKKFHRISPKSFRNIQRAFPYNIDLLPENA